MSVAIRSMVREEIEMSDLFWLTDEQMERLRPVSPKSHGKPRVDDRRVLSGIVLVARHGGRWTFGARKLRLQADFPTPAHVAGWYSGAAYRTRTCDPRITNAMLYQLS